MKFRLCEYTFPDGRVCDAVSVRGTGYCRHHKLDLLRAERIRKAADAVRERKQKVVKQRLYELATAIETPRAEVRKRLEALCSAGYIPKENVAVMTRLITFQHEVQRMILRDNKRFDSRMGCV